MQQIATVNLEGLSAVPGNFYVVMALEGEGRIGGTPVKAGEAVLAIRLSQRYPAGLMLCSGSARADAEQLTER